jgi:hypothetical protein
MLKNNNTYYTYYQYKVSNSMLINPNSLLNWLVDKFNNIMYMLSALSNKSEGRHWYTRTAVSV